MDEQAQDHQEVESLDLVGDSADTATKPNNRWTLVELALLFNCADLCLKNNIPWWETIRNLLEGISPQPRTEKASKKKLFKLLCDYHQSVSVTELLQQGTGCLTSENLDKNLLDEIKAQRPRLGLEPLTVRKSGQSSDTNVQTEPEIESRVSLKLRLPSVVNDSDDEPEPDGDPQDTDYDDRRSYTSRTTNKSKQGASKQVASESQHEIIQMKGKTGRRTEPALSVKPRQPSRTVHPAATEEPASTREVSSKSDSMPSKKRTAIEAEIIDLSDDESTSKPKQPKLKQRKPNEAPSGTTEPPRPSKAPETLRSKGASNVAPSRPKPNTHRTNPAVMIPTTNSAEIVQLVKDMQNTIESLSKRMDDTDYGWRSVLQEIVLDGKNWTPETKHRLQSLGIIMERDPGNLAVQLLKNFQSNDASNTDYAEQLHALLGRRDYTVKLEFPPATSSKEINQAWQAIRDGIKDAFINYSENSAEGPRLSAVSAGYIACTVDNLFSQAEIPKGLIPSMRAHLESRGAAQSLMSGLFCRWIFHQPDMMCAGKHNELTLKQYKVTLLNDGPSEVQHVDKVGLSLLFADKKYQESEFQTLTEQLVQGYSIAKSAFPSAPGIDCLSDPEAWVQGALKLKLKLMIARRDYRIHNCLPGTSFDSTWMRAEDIDGRAISDSKANSKKVIICLFPALVEQDPRALEKGIDVSECLMKNKNFFPTWQEREALDPKQVICKAVVLIT